jgi:hypothetical protein
MQVINGWQIIKGGCGTAEGIGCGETMRLRKPRNQNLRNNSETLCMSMRTGTKYYRLFREPFFWKQGSLSRAFHSH